MGMDKFPLHRCIFFAFVDKYLFVVLVFCYCISYLLYRPITLMDWNNITILPTWLSTITMIRAEHVSIVK
jgi:hypothetical protein